MPRKTSHSIWSAAAAAPLMLPPLIPAVSATSIRPAFFQHSRRSNHEERVGPGPRRCTPSLVFTNHQQIFLAVCNKTLISCCYKPLAVTPPPLSQSSNVSATFSSSYLGSEYGYLSRISFLCYVRHSIKLCELKFLHIYDLFPLEGSLLGFYQPFIYFTSEARFLFSSKIITSLMERVTFWVFKGINGINATRNNRKNFGPGWLSDWLCFLFVECLGCDTHTISKRCESHPFIVMVIMTTPVPGPSMWALGPISHSSSHLKHVFTPPL